MPDFYFDIETVPDESRAELLGLPPLPALKPITPADQCPPVESVREQALGQLDALFAQLNPSAEWLGAFEQAENADKKPRKGAFEAIKDHLADRKKAVEAVEERRKKLALTPETCRIVALGHVSNPDYPASGMLARASDADERLLLECFWHLVRSPGIRLIGFNCLGFDLPVIFVRSAILGVRPSRKLDLRPWGNDVLDLMAARWPKSPPLRLKTVARCYGIDVPAGDTDGGDVAHLLATDPERLRKYVESDVEITRELHGKLRGFFC